MRVLDPSQATILWGKLLGTSFQNAPIYATAHTTKRKHIFSYPAHPTSTSTLDLWRRLGAEVYVLRDLPFISLPPLRAPYNGKYKKKNNREFSPWLYVTVSINISKELICITELYHVYRLQSELNS